MKSLIYIVCLAFASISAEARVRRVTVNGDSIVSVRTAIGIATIIQVPDRPNSVIVGDQEAFKVEYLDQAITIKPLHGGAKSNLYVYTDWRRFNVQLITGSESLADYVVYLDNPKPLKEKGEFSTWRTYSNFMKNDEITFEATRLGQLKENLIAIEFKIVTQKNVKFDPSSIWLIQNGKTKPIHNLFVSDLNLKQKLKMTGVIQILTSDIETSAPLRIELRRNKTSYMTLPKVDSWKQLKAVH